MNKLYPADIRKDVLDISGPLADSMDQSIGEATTVMGAMITELMRRSLRGGILKVGEELQTFVIDRVDNTLSDRMPDMERAAVAVAEQTAQIAAAKVAAEEVHALDAKTSEAARQLASRIEETHETAKRELHGRIDEVHQKAHGAVEERAQTLVRHIEEVDRRAGETTRQTAEQLTGQIVETEKRVCEMTQTEISQRLNDVLEKAREGSAILKARLKALEELSESLGQQVRDEQASRKNEMQAGFAKLQQSLDHLGQKLSHGVELCQARVKDEVRDLRKANEDLAARVTALEQPKGFFSKLFGKKKEKGEAEE